jgi:hypothetical protein
MKRQGGGRPIYSALGIDSPILRICAALSAIEREWHRIVGHALAARSYPKAFEDGVLVVSVDGYSALQDMNFRKSQIMRAIRDNARLKLCDLKVETGSPMKLQCHALPPSAERRKNAPRIDPEALDKLSGEILSAHSDLDPELARSIARCRLMTSGRDKNGRQ